MSNPPPPRRNLHATRVSLALTWALALGARPAYAQIGDEDEPEAPAQAANQPFAFDESNFDQWVFGGRQPPGAGAASWFAAQLKFQSTRNSIACVRSIKFRRRSSGSPRPAI